MMYGQEVAETLAREGLIRPDAYGVKSDPTHWQVTVVYPADTRYYDVPRSLLNELKPQYPKGLEHTVKHTFDTYTKAQRNVTMLTRKGFNTRLTPMVLLEVGNTK